jgi:hypothetical protein
MGSINIATIIEYNLDNRGFWAIEMEEVYTCYAKLDPLMDNLDSDDNNLDFHTKLEGNDEHLDWLNIVEEG